MGDAGAGGGKWAAGPCGWGCSDGSSGRGVCVRPQPPRPHALTLNSAMLTLLTGLACLFRHTGRCGQRGQGGRCLLLPNLLGPAVVLQVGSCCHIVLHWSFAVLHWSYCWQAAAHQAADRQLLPPPLLLALLPKHCGSLAAHSHAIRPPWPTPAPAPCICAATRPLHCRAASGQRYQKTSAGCWSASARRRSLWGRAPLAVLSWRVVLTWQAARQAPASSTCPAAA